MAKGKSEGKDVVASKTGSFSKRSTGTRGVCVFCSCCFGRLVIWCFVMLLAVRLHSTMHHFKTTGSLNKYIIARIKDLDKLS
jgi:hypothetical protein